MYYKGQKMLISIYTNIFTEEQCKVKKKNAILKLLHKRLKIIFYAMQQSI